MEQTRRTLIPVWLNAWSQLLIATAEEEPSRPYVRPEHEPFLETRFRTFDEYLAAASPESFLGYTRAYPAEFQELYECLAPLITHPPNH
ncbi:hypothetical protein Aduo_018833 [Ancylostoma duodenale]